MSANLALTFSSTETDSWIDRQTVTEPLQRFKDTRVDNLLAFLINAMQCTQSRIFAHRLICGMSNR